MKLTLHREVLVVEDDPNDIFLYERAFERVIDPERITFLRNGEELITHCARFGRPDDEEEGFELPDLPGLIILDIKMPIKSGLDVLEWFRNRPVLRRIPIVIISSSQAHRDINTAYELGANAYIVKPLEFNVMVRTIDEICRFWLNTITPPTYH